MGRTFFKDTEVADLSCLILCSDDILILFHFIPTLLVLILILLSDLVTLVPQATPADCFFFFFFFLWSGFVPFFF